MNQHLSRILVRLFLFGLGASGPIHATPPEFHTPQLRLYYAACDDDPEGIRKALDQGADIDELSDRGFNALHFAILWNRKKSVSLLLKAGADPEAFTGIQSMNALSLAAVYNRKEILDALLEYGADPMKGRTDRWLCRNAFTYAVLYGRTDLVRRMVARGADPHLPYHFRGGTGSNPRERSLLTFAAQHGDVEIVRLLVEEYGLPVNSTSRNPEAHALWVATKYGNTEVVEYLIGKGAKVNPILNPSKLGLLSVAAQHGRHDITRILLEHGAGIPDNTPYTKLPHLLADWGGFDKVYALYEQRGYDSGLWRHFQKKWIEKSTSKKDAPHVTSSGWTSKLLEGAWTAGGKTTGPSSSVDSIRLAIIPINGGRALTDLLTVRLNKAPHLDLVERGDLDKVLEEHHLLASGAVSDPDLSKVSRLLGAQALILVKEFQMEESPFLSIRLVDSRYGILLGTSYASHKTTEHEKFLREYIPYVQLKLGKLLDSPPKKRAVALVNVRADQGTANGLRLEAYCKRVLERELSEAKDILLLQRSHLESSLLEKHLRRETSEPFLSSSLFLEARLTLKKGGEGIQSVLFRFQPRNGEDTRVEIVNREERDLPFLHRAVAEAMKTLSNPESHTTHHRDLGLDAEKLYAEARWLSNVGLTEEALDTMRGAIALGFDELKGWIRYLGLIRNCERRLTKLHGSEEQNRERLRLARERLMALDGYWRLWQRTDVPSARKQVHWSIKGPERSGFGDVGASLEFFRPVTLSRRYRPELEEIEAAYIDLLRRRMLPMFRTRDPDRIHRLAKKGTGGLLNNLLAPLASFRYHPLGEMERIAADFLTAHSEMESHLKIFPSGSFPSSAYAPPAMGPEWNHRFLGWLGKYGSLQHQVEYARELLQNHGRGKFKKHLVFSIRDHQEIYTQLHKAYQNGSEMERASWVYGNPHLKKMFLNYSQGTNEPLLFSILISGNRRIYRPKVFEEAFLDTAIRIQRELTTEAWEYNHLDVLRRAETAFRNRKEVKGDTSIQTQKRLEEFTRKIATMEAARGNDSQKGKRVSGEMTARIWHPSLFGFPEFTTRARILHRPILKDGAWWVVGAYSENRTTKGDSTFALFKINAETLQTTANTFTTDTLPWCKPYEYEAALGDSQLALWRKRPKEYMERKGVPPLVFLDTSTMGISTHTTYMPLRGGYAIGDDFYCLVEPYESYEESWTAAEPPETLMLVKYTMPGEKTEVLFNSRRNPPKTIMDRPPGPGYFFSYYPEIHSFLLGEYFRAVYDISSGEFKEFGRDKYQDLKIHSVDTHGLRKRFFTPQGAWGLGTFQPSDANKVHPSMFCFEFKPHSRTGSKDQYQTERKSIRLIFAEPTKPFAPYESYKASMEQSLLKFDKEGGRFWFGKDYGYARVTPPHPDRNTRAPFLVFFQVNEFKKALDSAPNLNKIP